ncbi:conserved hypothetical protein [Cupriavidus taiwanensis]|uniref:hypothetical protein n=1 Tax=Cupriavidus taiwanensis TaxID=164546 RepID=UPI000E172B8C|nr:hypothetical protein [Cupriavidus taiwanensis]SOZ99440.1 conserved hypothetical protein [Cupriavidus taiwanensis]
MTVRLYKSTDASAPSLTGQVGSLVALLDAVLVNGYGSQTAAGWTKAYSGTNAASYRMVTSGNTGFYLDVADNASSTAREARMRGYESMSAVATGTGPFPTSAQSSFGVVCRKSASSDSVARPWYIVADGSCFYLLVDTGDFTNPSYALGFGFGDFFSYAASDPYRCMILGRNGENTSSTGNEILCQLDGSANAFGQVNNRANYLARTWTGTGGSVQFTKFSSLLSCYSGGSTQSKQVMGGNQHPNPFPNGPDGGLILSPVYIGHNLSVRGYLKGLWNPNHYQPCAHGDAINGTGNMSGKSFLALCVQTATDYTGGSGQLMLETSNTWS